MQPLSNYVVVATLRKVYAASITGAAVLRLVDFGNLGFIRLS
jgi:hypothetical protein